MIQRSKSDEAVNTCVNFTDRSQGAEDLTQAEIAKLYEHIQAMPDTARKRKLLKKVLGNNFPLRHEDSDNNQLAD